MISGISSSIPSIGFSPMASPANGVALTLLALSVISSIPSVSAGPVAYANCVTAAGGNVWAALACLPLLLVPEAV